MALRLFISNFKFKKLDDILTAGPKSNPAEYLRRYFPKVCHRSFHKYPKVLRQYRYIPSKQCRAIYIPSVLFGKVVPFKLSDIGEGIVEVTVKEWFVKPGDKIAQFDNICEVQSDKASVTITSRFDGVVKKLHYEIDEMAKVGDPLIDIELEESAEAESDSDEETDAKPSSVSDSSTKSKLDDDPGSRALATPAVRRIAKENNVNIQEIAGTGRGGRVLKEDILLHLENAKDVQEKKPVEKTPTPEPPPRPEAPKKVLQFSHEDRKLPITGFKKAMFKTMTAAWNVPHFSYCDEIDVEELVKKKGDLAKIGQSNKVKLTFMPFFIKAASLALTKYPELNSHVDPSGEFLNVKGSHNIGVAMDTANGLVVPNIKNVQNLTVIEVARELNRLQDLGARGQLGLADLKDGTFTLSNVGAIGGTYTKPLLLLPEVVIGGLGKIQVLPRFDEEKNVREIHMLIVSWSADHRVVDGATLARFSNLWKAYLAAPQLLLQV